MRLTVLGSSGTYPTPGRPASGYLIDHDGARLWVDAGPGTFAVLQEYLDPAELDAVVLSHVHPDHCVDVFALYHALRFGPRVRSDLPLIAPEGVAERLAGFLDAGEDHGWFDVFDLRTVGEGDQESVGEMTLSFAITDHPVPTVAVRVEAEERTFVYSSDTGPEGGAPGLSKGADLLLCEATYQGPEEEKPWPHHLTASEAGGIAREAGAKRLMLTHLWPTFDPARSVEEAEEAFGRSVALAAPGMEAKV